MKLFRVGFTMDFYSKLVVMAGDSQSGESKLLNILHSPCSLISLSHGRYFRQFWGTATFTSESLHTARCNSLYL